MKFWIFGPLSPETGYYLGGGRGRRGSKVRGQKDLNEGPVEQGAARPATGRTGIQTVDQLHYLRPLIVLLYYLILFSCRGVRH